MLSFGDVACAEGGVPIVVDGKIIGAIGVQSHQDGQTAQAGADALNQARA